MEQTMNNGYPIYPFGVGGGRGGGSGGIEHPQGVGGAGEPMEFGKNEGPQPPKGTVVEKWAVPGKDWGEISSNVRDELHNYEMRGFCIRGDVTRDQMRTEFFERIALEYGFNIDWRKDAHVSNDSI